MLTRMDLCWIYHDTSTAAWVKKTSIAMMSWHLLRSCLLSLGLMSNFVPPSNINQCYVRICRENLHSTTQSYNMLQPWSLLVLMFQGNKNLEPDKVWLNPTSSCDHRHSIACRMRICADSMGKFTGNIGFWPIRVHHHTWYRWPIYRWFTYSKWWFMGNIGFWSKCFLQPLLRKHANFCRVWTVH